MLSSLRFHGGIVKKWTTFEGEEQARGQAVLSLDVERSFSLDPTMFRKSVDSMLRVLSENDWVAICFVEGEALNWYPELLNVLHDHGHEVGSHGFRHQNQQKYSVSELETELERSLA